MHVEMKGISKYFGAVKALENVDFTINEHEIHGLMGENGAGKSTLMNILGGAIQPTEGEIYINGELIEKMTISLATEIGIRFIHQELNLVNDLKVYENLYLGEEIKDIDAAKNLIKKAFTKRLIDSTDCCIDYGFHTTICGMESNLNDFIEESRLLGIPTIKFFTTYSTSDRRTNDHIF